VPVRATANFIVDGGAIRDFFSTDTGIFFSFSVGAINRGSVGPQTDQFRMEDDSRSASMSISSKNYGLSIQSDAAGALTFRQAGLSDLDLGATFDPLLRLVEIPFSFQTIDLGILQPGDRLLLGYSARISVTQDGDAEGIFAHFSDPFDLGANGPLDSVTLTPLDTMATQVPGPASLPLLGGGLVLLMVARRACLGSHQTGTDPAY